MRTRCSVLSLYLGAALGMVACAQGDPVGDGDASVLPDAEAVTIDGAEGLGFWEVCVEHGDCASDICYREQESDPSGHCTMECDGICPDGFACQVVLIADYSDLRVCIPAEDTFCAPCTANAQCGDSEDFCVALTEGLVCTIDCSDDPTVCPPAFTCQTVSGVGDTLVGKQCMPINGICCIDADGDLRGEGSGCLATDCDDDNDAVYDDADEICDGFDNDCVGGVDVDPVDCAVAECHLGALGYYEVPAEPCEGAECTPQSSSLCGLYTCSEGGDNGDACAAACDGEDDGKCIPAAHCDASVCYDDLADGQACDELSDCESEHCQNDFCCDHGDCCTTAEECPTWGSTTSICNDPSTCQGTRGEPVCQSFICSSGGTEPDDSGCTATTVSNSCGWYLPVYCNGEESQTAPDCPTSCSSHADCDPGGFCDPASNTCVEDREDGQQCSEAAWCKSGHCQNGFCCDDGDCCSMPADCPASYSQAPECEIPSACYGTRDDATCVDHECGTLPGIEDDSGCGPGVEASNCGAYVSTYCDGSAAQTAPDCYTSCTSDSQCDANAHCDASNQCVLDVPQGGSCMGTGDCMAGLVCVDGVCCDGLCGGVCQACNVPGSLGHCTQIPTGQDPDGECLGGSCAGYYWGWSGDTCYGRTDLSDEDAVCQADGTCLTPAEACPTQAQGTESSSCDSGDCESPTAGTCTGTMAGACTDDALVCYDYTTCTAGVRMCVSSCPAEPTEVCDLDDNNCDGQVDEGFWGDSSNGDVDFPDSWFGPILAGYPPAPDTYYTSGTVSGKILPEGDSDWFSISAAEELWDWCLTDDQDQPVEASIQITPPSGEWYTVCACFSSAGGQCDLSGTVCTTAQGSASDTVSLQMDMNCGSDDEGYLDIEVSPDLASLDLSCSEYTVTWEVWEND